MIPTYCGSCGALNTTDGTCRVCDEDLEHADTERAPAPSLLGDDSRALLYAMPLALALGGAS